MNYNGIDLELYLQQTGSIIVLTSLMILSSSVEFDNIQFSQKYNNLNLYLLLIC